MRTHRALASLVTEFEETPGGQFEVESESEFKVEDEAETSAW
jgi:hypothetical protein